MASPVADWLVLLDLAAQERDLAEAGRWEELDALGTERASLATTLGDPPAAARPVLERALAMQEELIATILRARGATLDELGRLRRGRGAVHGYGATAGTRGGWIDHSG
jgi:hypothetical protein